MNNYMNSIRKQHSTRNRNSRYADPNDYSGIGK